MTSETEGSGRQAIHDDEDEGTAGARRYRQLGRVELMARLLVMIEVDADPALIDPQELAEELVSVHQAEAEHSGVLAPISALYSAEWRAHAPVHIDH